MKILYQEDLSKGDFKRYENEEQYSMVCLNFVEKEIGCLPKQIRFIVYENPKGDFTLVKTGAEMRWWKGNRFLFKILNHSDPEAGLFCPPLSYRLSKFVPSKKTLIDKLFFPKEDKIRVSVKIEDIT